MIVKDNKLPAEDNLPLVVHKEALSKNRPPVKRKQLEEDSEMLAEDKPQMEDSTLPAEDSNLPVKGKHLVQDKVVVAFDGEDKDLSLKAELVVEQANKDLLGQAELVVEQANKDLLGQAELVVEIEEAK